MGNVNSKDNHSWMQNDCLLSYHKRMIQSIYQKTKRKMNKKNKKSLYSIAIDNNHHSDPIKDNQTLLCLPSNTSKSTDFSKISSNNKEIQESNAIDLDLEDFNNSKKPISDYIIPNNNSFCFEMEDNLNGYNTEIEDDHNDNDDDIKNKNKNIEIKEEMIAPMDRMNAPQITMISRYSDCNFEQDKNIALSTPKLPKEFENLTLAENQTEFENSVNCIYDQWNCDHNNDESDINAIIRIPSNKHFVFTLEEQIKSLNKLTETHTPHNNDNEFKYDNNNDMNDIHTNKANSKLITKKKPKSFEFNTPASNFRMRESLVNHVLQLIDCEGSEDEYY